MFGGKKSGKPQNKIDSLIGAGTRIEGNITFSGGLRVDGEVQGNIRCEEGPSGMLVISEQAKVEGEISVGHVVINGNVIGPVFAGESLELLPNARVTGDVEYHQLEMQQGAVVQGRLVHQTSASAKTVELKLASSN
ncbi:MAG: cell shape determination protein CcmA [Candidatus Accumulibacter sp. 66-26]|nr:polymer-forming cytoskeletal protein [Accumulibacter sp.]OJW48836.1 MAG: cell shape determination protein CcmA [Candidatus Accumulibacter sp. 66-26]